MTNRKPWHEEDRFWEAVTPILFGKRRWEEAPKEVESMITLLGLEPGMKVLDLCCGVGRHSLELARRGFVVTAVDRTESYLRQASELAKKEGLTIEFVKEDMRNFIRPNAFDAVINFYTSFGYFEDPDDDRKVIKNVYQSLKVGGVLLIEMMGKEILARIFRERDWFEEDGLLILEERKLGDCWDRVETRWIIIRENQRIEQKLSLRLYSAVELRSLLSECGFKEIEIYGDLQQSPYNQMARRLIAITRK